MINYNEWVEKEYTLWEDHLEKILQNKISFQTFRQDPQVLRMIGLSTDFNLIYHDLVKDCFNNNVVKKILEIDNIGIPSESLYSDRPRISTVTLRYIYYALKVISLLDNSKPLKILEIGGGYGGFSSIFHLLAEASEIKINNYGLYDRPKIQKFQKYYIDKAYPNNQVTLYDCFDLKLEDSFDIIVSFYALGEFSSSIRNSYIDKVINKINKGYIIWNPHLDEGNQVYTPESDNSLKLITHDIKVNKEYPLTSERNLEILW
jgi:hypothetical protein